MVGVPAAVWILTWLEMGEVGSGQTTLYALGRLIVIAVIVGLAQAIWRVRS